MSFLKLLLFFFIIPHSSLKGMKQDIQKYSCENYLELLPSGVYNELLNFKGQPEIGFWLSKYKEPKL